MKKIKYVIKSILNMDFKGFFNVISRLSKKTHKSKIFLFFDIIYCGFAYMAGYADYELFEFYNLKRYQRKTVITRGQNDKIVKMFNGKDYIDEIDDKLVFHERYKKYLNRDYLDLRKTSCDEFISYMKSKHVAMAKALDQTGGNGVDKINDKQDLTKLYNKLLSNKQYLVEDYIVQHKDISKIYPCSVNTLRIVTLYKNNKVHIMYRGIRFGNKGHTVDNFHSGGMFTIIDEDGVIRKPAADKKRDVYSLHPYTNEKIVGFTVPYFKETIDYCITLAKVTPSVGYIGWDIAVTPNGPTVIEGNSYPGHVLYQSKIHLDDSGIGMLPAFQKIINEEGETK
ncbi:MAG: sugar-transfer associated ATP-grasp domain-containing protein [Bacilli bacterium]